MPLSKRPARPARQAHPLRKHMGRYSLEDARLDNEHLAERQVRELMRLAERKFVPTPPEPLEPR